MFDAEEAQRADGHALPRIGPERARDRARDEVEEEPEHELSVRGCKQRDVRALVAARPGRLATSAPPGSEEHRAEQHEHGPTHPRVQNERYRVHRAGERSDACYRVAP